MELPFEVTNFWAVRIDTYGLALSYVTRHNYGDKVPPKVYKDTLFGMKLIQVELILNSTKYWLTQSLF